MAPPPPPDWAALCASNQPRGKMLQLARVFRQPHLHQFPYAIGIMVHLVSGIGLSAPSNFFVIKHRFWGSHHSNRLINCSFVCPHITTPSTHTEQINQSARLARPSSPPGSMLSHRGLLASPLSTYIAHRTLLLLKKVLPLGLTASTNNHTAYPACKMRERWQTTSRGFPGSASAWRPILYLR